MCTSSFKVKDVHTFKVSPFPTFHKFFRGNTFGIELCCNKHTCWCLLYLTWSWWNQNALNRLMTRAGRTIKATVRLNHQSVFVFRCRSIATRTSEANPIYNQPWVVCVLNVISLCLILFVKTRPNKKYIINYHTYVLAKAIDWNSMKIPVTCKVEYDWYEAFSQLPLAKDFHRPVVGECPTETPGLISHDSRQLLDLGLDCRNGLHGMPLDPIQRGTTVPGYKSA